MPPADPHDGDPRPERNPLPEIPPHDTHRGLLDVLERHTHPGAAAAADALRRISPEELVEVLRDATGFVTRDDQFAGHLIAGNFAGGRGRMILRLNADGLEERFPFLRFACVKLVKMDNLVARELNTHLEVQRRIDAAGSQLRVPRLLAHVRRRESEEAGIILERLEADAHNGSLQTFVEGLRRGTPTRVLRLTSETAADIVSAFNQFHRLGFIHHDVNDGNVFLANATHRDVVLPAAYGRQRPTVRLVNRADIVLLDFERTIGFPQENAASYSKEIEAENEEVRAMLKEVELEVSADDADRDVAEAYDEMLRRRIENDRRASKIA